MNGSTSLSSDVSTPPGGGSKSTRKPTNFGHHKTGFKAGFTASLFKATSKVLKPLLTSSQESLSQRSSSFKRGSVHGSSASINSFVDEKGVLVTPPPRRLGRARSAHGSVSSIKAAIDATVPLQPKQLSNPNLTATQGHSYESVSLSVSIKPPIRFGSVNSVVRADGTLLTPPPRKHSCLRSKQGSTATINSFVDERGNLVTPPPRKQGSVSSVKAEGHIQLSNTNLITKDPAF